MNVRRYQRLSSAVRTTGFPHNLCAEIASIASINDPSLTPAPPDSPVQPSACLQEERHGWRTIGACSRSGSATAISTADTGFFQCDRHQNIHAPTMPKPMRSTGTRLSGNGNAVSVKNRGNAASTFCAHRPSLSVNGRYRLYKARP